MHGTTMSVSHDQRIWVILSWTKKEKERKEMRREREEKWREEGTNHRDTASLEGKICALLVSSRVPAQDLAQKRKQYLLSEAQKLKEKSSETEEARLGSMVGLSPEITADLPASVPPICTKEKAHTRSQLSASIMLSDLPMGLQK